MFNWLKIEDMHGPLPSEIADTHCTIHAYVQCSYTSTAVPMHTNTHTHIMTLVCTDTHTDTHTHTHTHTHVCMQISGVHKHQICIHTRHTDILSPVLAGI